MFGLPSNLTAFASLARFLPMAISELTADDIQLIISTVVPGAVLTPQMASGIAQILAEDDVDRLADLLGKPETLAKLKTFVLPIPPTEAVVQCPHCRDFHIVPL